MPIVIRSVAALDAGAADLIAHARDAFARSRPGPDVPAAGAAVISAGGAIYSGSTMAVGASSLCAERVAMSAALSAGERSISILAIVLEVESAGLPSPRHTQPCGRCRQMLADLAVRADQDVLVYLADAELTGIVLTTGLELVPDCVGPLLRHLNVPA